MGMQLVRKIIQGRPQHPGCEWWTLLDLADLADDRTGQAWPGHAYLMERAGVTERHIMRRLAALTAAGWLTTAGHGAGRKVIYQITIPGAHRP